MERGQPVLVWIERWLWPLVRLLAVAAALGLWGHWHYGWNPPTSHQLEQFAGTILGLFLFCAFLSAALVQVFSAIVCFPLYAAIVLNDWLYCASLLLLRRLFGERSPHLEAGLAAVGEFGVAVSLWWAIELLAKCHCHY